jgi:hypothetical protein
MSALDHNVISCATEGCFAVITVHPIEEARLRRTRESFYCPAGHSNYFPGKTEEQKRIEQLERSLVRMQDRASAMTGNVWDLLDHAKRCPFDCGWRARRHTKSSLSAYHLGQLMERIDRDVRDHLETTHGAEVIEDAEVAA